MIPLGRDLALDVLQTALRMFPWPTEPGLRVSGTPNADSPVLVTANYDLTVRRLLRTLDGIDAWVVVAPARGINVWCAAAGGHLSTHQVVTALKTCGVAERVQHRDLILPQLAATGVEGLDLFRRTRWRVRFGPVHMEDLPAYLASGGDKTDAMRRVRFGPFDRLEMAVAWGAPTAAILGAGAAALRPAWAFPLVALTAALALVVFFAYDRFPKPRRLVLVGLATAASLAAVLLAGGGLSAGIAAAIAAVALSLLLTFDYAGSTPLEGSGQHEGHDWRIALDTERCAGVLRCVEVCPEACFERGPDPGTVLLAHDDRCVRCGACVVQCPKDALFFEAAGGQRVEPDTIRRYKLNLLGRRSVDRAASG